MTHAIALVHVPFDCPECGNSYHVELDLFKLTRLNRVAVCGHCRCEFDVTIRLKRGEAPAADGEEQATPAPPPSSPPAHRSKRARRPRKAPVRQRTKPDGLGLSPDMLAAISEVAEVEPKVRGLPTEPDLPRVDIPDVTSQDRIPTKPNLRAPSEPYDGSPERAPRQAELPATDSQGPPRVDTLPGTKVPVSSGVAAHIIVEVGTAGGAKGKRKTTKSYYRPSRLATKKGLGIPADLGESEGSERKA